MLRILRRRYRFNSRHRRGLATYAVYNINQMYMMLEFTKKYGNNCTFSVNIQTDV